MATTPQLPVVAEAVLDELIYLARAGDQVEMAQLVDQLAVDADFDPFGPERKAAAVAAVIDVESGNSLVHYAAANGHLQTLNYLLTTLSTSEQSTSPSAPAPPTRSFTSPISRQNKSGNTPLHWAALNGHVDAVQALLKAGADVTLLNSAGHDAVYEAEVADKGAVVDLLLKEGIGLDGAIASDLNGHAADQQDEDEEDEEEQGQTKDGDVDKDKNTPV